MTRRTAELSNAPVPTDTHPLPVGTSIRHPTFGLGRIAGHDRDKYLIQFEGQGTKLISFEYEGLTVEEAAAEPGLDLVKQAVREVLGEYGVIETEAEMGQRWVGGMLVLRPGKEDTQEREIPLEVFLKKIIGVREKLRVLEQRINSHASLSAEEKLELQGYLTRCYGSLTTFNALFASPEGQFKGQSSG